MIVIRIIFDQNNYENDNHNVCVCDDDCTRCQKPKKHHILASIRENSIRVFVFVLVKISLFSIRCYWVNCYFFN